MGRMCPVLPGAQRDTSGADRKKPDGQSAWAREERPGGGHFCENSSGAQAAISALMRAGTCGAELHEGCEKLLKAGGRRLALVCGMDMGH